MDVRGRIMTEDWTRPATACLPLRALVRRGEGGEQVAKVGAGLHLY